MPSEKGEKMRQKNNKVVLSETERSMKTKKLRDRLRAAGYEVSRATVYRAKERGWFMTRWGRHGYHPQVRSGAKGVVGWVTLTQDELSAVTGVGRLQWLADQLGISSYTARRAVQRGWFEVNQQNMGSVRVPRSRIRKKPPK